MVNKNMPLGQTNAGRELESELAKERENFEKQLGVKRFTSDV
jgi:hypothetical protein